ncbi:DUF5658 family protein [Alkalihalobacillus macyae]|uniref:DUF5658 family protein n=1 Tax=Guptibacillus hwajinpoensis TaxID=208199 RepID=UPI00273ADA6D|nr:DUF5658 family protein [Alkalihalobacillus macyae]MDP4551593.1 DUF5658 family protein [Alkalihalobacillus macyae]
MKGKSTFRFLIIYLGCCNLLDGFVTFLGLENGWIEEVNPLMRSLYEWHPIAFLSYKTGISLLLLSFLLFNKQIKSVIVRILLSVASIIYTFLLCLHAYWLLLLSFIAI